MMNILSVLPKDEISSYETAWSHATLSSSCIMLFFLIAGFIAVAICSKSLRKKITCVGVVLFAIAGAFFVSNTVFSEKGGYPYITTNSHYTIHSDDKYNFMLNTAKHYYAVKHHLPQEWKTAFKAHKQTSKLSNQSTINQHNYRKYIMSGYALSKPELKARNDQRWLNWITPRFKYLHYHKPYFHDYL